MVIFFAAADVSFYQTSSAHFRLLVSSPSSTSLVTSKLLSLISILNKAIDQATTIHEKEVAAVASEGIPKIPGMDLF